MMFRKKSKTKTNSLQKTDDTVYSASSVFLLHTKGVHRVPLFTHFVLKCISRTFYFLIENRIIISNMTTIVADNQHKSTIVNLCGKRDIPIQEIKGGIQGNT